jgi:hypothetical protein
MKIRDINAEWAKDSVIEISDLTDAARAVNVLHAKYLRMLTQAKLELRVAQTDYFRLRGVKGRYYRGELTKKELDEKGWQQFQKKLLKAGVEEAMQEDEEMIKSETILNYRKVKVEQLESILKAINGRSHDIRNTIQFYTYQNGG